ncbi:Uu.00g011350.m01.CDS01 [Anthostomella pinea]|uniref:Uu.00g011350.m01.CDS01 n=1 Tax=Anthostomella pinea TaxID=933095 RepID=A0AAI8VRZ6_9PEZI|nr:Uu.00g011350.m01.CDS01 [Anthostomella pinea]
MQEFLRRVLKATKEVFPRGTTFELGFEDGQLLTASSWLRLMNSREFSEVTFNLSLTSELDDDDDSDNGSDQSTLSPPMNPPARPTTVSRSMLETPSARQPSRGRSRETARTEKNTVGIDSETPGQAENPLKKSCPETLEPQRKSMGYPGSTDGEPNLPPFFTWLQSSRRDQLDSENSKLQAVESLLQSVDQSMKDRDGLYKATFHRKLHNLRNWHQSWAIPISERGKRSSSEPQPASAASIRNFEASKETESQQQSQTSPSQVYSSRKSSYHRPSLSSPKIFSTSFDKFRRPHRPKSAMGKLLANTNPLLFRLVWDRDTVADIPGVVSDVQDVSNHIREMVSILNDTVDVSSTLLRLFVPLDDHEDNDFVQKYFGSLDQVLRHPEFSLAMNNTTDHPDQWSIGDFTADISRKMGNALSILAQASFKSSNRSNEGSRWNRLRTTLRDPNDANSKLITKRFEKFKTRALDCLDRAQKDIILFSSTAHTGGVFLRPIGREFLVAAILTNLQNQLYDEGMRRRLFFEIKAVGLELDALRNIFKDQLSMFRKYVAILNPRSLRIPNEDRDRQLILEADYIQRHLQALNAKDDELRYLQLQAKDLKLQVKQSIEILEEDHGKAIFTIVTLFFLPITYLTDTQSLKVVHNQLPGDEHNIYQGIDKDQKFFWTISIPMTATVVGLALIYGYKWDSVLDFASTAWEVFQRRREGKQKATGLDTPELYETRRRDDRVSSTRSIWSVGTSRQRPGLLKGGEV